MNTKSVRLLTILAFAFILLLSLEFFSYMLLSPQEKKLKAQDLLSVHKNDFLDSFGKQQKCSFAETTIGHPMLGFVHRSADYLPEDCKYNSLVNNIGMASNADLPLKNNNEEYRVLILGGSVAYGLSTYYGKHLVPFFEQALNNKYYPPNGKKIFKIYTGAAGGWNMPNQLNMLLMYGERIDAAVALDGYNEAIPIQFGRRLEQVQSAQYILANTSITSYKFKYLNFLFGFKNLLLHSSLKHSYFCNILYRAFVGIFQKHMITQEDISEFRDGNSEKITLPFEKAKDWSLKSLERYISLFHHTGKFLGVKTAQFLQPTRLYGKNLTTEERTYFEQVDLKTYQKMESMYDKLRKENYPIASLTNIFQNEQGTIYSDHIHYQINPSGVSRGNELVINSIVNQLGKMWGLRAKK